MSETFTKVRYGLVGLLLLFCAAVSAQTISGNVKDANGEPVIGATIMEQGTQNGTVTDFDGNFTLKLQKGGNINVSYVGMKSQVIKTAGKSSVNVTLEDDNTTLNDLVVVGYGTMKKSDLTGSVSSVNTEQLNAKGASSVMGNLQGATPGVNISQTSSRAGGGFNIEIRGKSSLGDNNNPLFVVDGVICDDIDWLNPQDIEKIDILKDASSTAIYGSRATNGVVIVSTKSAKTQGGKVSKPTISYDGYIGFTKIARKPDFMNGSQFLQYRFLQYLSEQQDNTTSQGLTSLGSDSNYGKAVMRYNLDGESRSWIKDRIAAGETDWTDLVTRNAIQMNHYLAVSGNANNTNYHFGFGYQKDEGVYKGDDMYRYNLKGTVDTKISEVLSAGISLNGAFKKSKTVNDEALTNSLQNENSLVTPYNSDGGLYVYPGQAGFDRSVYGLPSDIEEQFNSNMNPLLDFENSYYEQKNYQFLANLYVEARPLKGLSLKTTFSPNYIQNRAGEFDGTYTSNTETNGNNNKTQAINTSKFSWTWDNQINYTTRIKDIHSINAMYLLSTSKFSQEKYTQGVKNFTEELMWYNMSANDEIYSLGSAYTEWSMVSHAFRLNYGFMDKYLLTATVRWDGSSRFAEGRRWGSFPSVAFAWRITEEPWMKKVDWLSNLKLRLSYGVTGNNYVGSNYPTVLSVAKANSYYGFADKTGQTGSIPTNGNGSAVINKELTWEKTGEFNLGLDFGFLNNRINGSIDFYTKKSKDLLLSRTLIYELGGAKVSDNVGTVRNSGVEISLSTVNIKNKDWNWTTSFNFAHNKNKILELNDGKTSDETNGWWVGESINAIYNYNYLGVVSDQPISLSDAQYALYQQNGGTLDRSSILSRDYYYQVYKTREGAPIIEDLNLDGNIDDSDKKILGHADPSWTGSITSNLSYKNWDFSFSIYTRQGTTMYSPFYGKYINYGDRGNNHVNFDYYIPAGTLLACDGVNDDGSYINPVYQPTTQYGTFPFPCNDKNFMSYNAKSGAGTAYQNAKTYYKGTEDNPNINGQPLQIVKGNYWKVSNISLGYTFPKKLLQSWGCQHLRLYVNVTNPFIWSTDNYLGFNPEWADASLADGGYSTVTWQIGASIKF